MESACIPWVCSQTLAHMDVLWWTEEPLRRRRVFFIQARHLNDSSFITYPVFLCLILTSLFLLLLFFFLVIKWPSNTSLDCKEIKSVNLKGNQSWIFIGRADAEAPIFWPPDAKIWLIWKDPDARKDWRQGLFNIYLYTFIASHNLCTY